MTGFNGRDLGSRVAGLLQARFQGDLVAAACDLAVDPNELRRIVEGNTDTPDLNVLAKLVRHFGIDVCWLMTGEYDWRSHMSLLDAEDERADDANHQLILRLAERRDRSGPSDVRRAG